VIGTDSAFGSLVAPIARAVRDDRVTSLAATLADLVVRDAFGPECFLPPNPGRYARNLIWHDPDGAFVIVGMTWAPGQGSPLHDHAGLWGAEVVVDGTMSETLFTLTERGGDGRYRFERGPHRVNARGTVGVLIPPLEYHDFGNSGSTVAHTLHVYGGDLSSSQAFADDGDGWWSPRRVELRYDG
jgi:3-mercaptopropionate dioxygenase